MTNGTERRVIVGTLEKRDVETGGVRLVGYAAKFNSLSEDMGFREKIAPGAFARAIKEKQDVRALINHDEGLVIGRTKAGTLVLSEDQTGLRMECKPPNTSYANDLMESIARGDIDQMSFSFRCVTDAWEMRDGEQIRTLKDVDLFDVAPVTFPAYTDTSIGMRSLEQFKKTIVVIAPAALRRARLEIAKRKAK